MADHPDRTRAVSAVGIVFPSPDMQGVESPATTPTRCGGAEADRSDRLSLGFLIHAYFVFSGAGATCEAADPPVGGMVSGSAKNLPTICGTSGEVMKL